MATIPANSTAEAGAEVTVASGEKKTETFKDRRILILPEGAQFDPDHPNVTPNVEKDLRHMSRSKNLGVLFAMVLLLVIIITNVPLRGMWSVMIIMTVVMLVIIFWLADLWPWIVSHWTLLDIRVNAGGYFFIGIVLFAIWLLTFLFFDKQIYMVFVPGQLKVCTEIGGGEEVYPTFGTTLAKQRSDLFRHWILGLGSGDLIVNTGGPERKHIDLPNVLFVGKKKQLIEDMLRERAVLETK
jgi:hypothetical protein